MKKVIFGLSFLGLFIFGCAAADIVPDLSLRELRISRTVPGFEYQYRVCKKKILGACTKTEMVVEYFDLNDVQMRNKLIDMGFTARVREKVIH